ncbi:hypothetical protein MHYP_G00195400 [Metynnis hypsauchen]
MASRGAEEHGDERISYKMSSCQTDWARMAAPGMLLVNAQGDNPVTNLLLNSGVAEQREAFRILPSSSRSITCSLDTASVEQL